MSKLNVNQKTIYELFLVSMPIFLIPDYQRPYWDVQKEQAYQHLWAQENLKPEAMKTVLDNYEFTKRLPRKEELKDLPKFKIKLFERENVFNQLWDKTRKFIQAFYTGL